MTQITLLNQPKLSEHEVDKKFNERRTQLVPIIQKYISDHVLFKNLDVSVYFIEKGVSSLVTKIETTEKTYILKVPLSLTFANGEGMFLKVWQQGGIKVPRIYEEGLFGDLNYILMEYIDTPTLGDKYGREELIEKKIYTTLGRTLRMMHTPKTEGYGSVVHGKAEYARFSDWLNGPDMKKRVNYIHEHAIISHEHGSLSSAFELLSAYVESENGSSYCHDDFGTSNIFATDPITVFDPNPRFNNGYLDLGRSIVMLAARNAIAEIEQLIEGYFENNPFNKKILQASVLINAVMKIPYSHKKGRVEIISNIQTYLMENKSILEN